MNKHRDKNNVTRLPVVSNKHLKGISDADLQLAYAGVDALMRNRIPAAANASESGIQYDGANNAIERVLAFTWLTCQGTAVITKIRTSPHNDFTEAQIQTLVNGIAQAFREDMMKGIEEARKHGDYAQAPEAANDGASPA